MLVVVQGIIMAILLAGTGDAGTGQNGRIFASMRSGNTADLGEYASRVAPAVLAGWLLAKTLFNALLPH